MTCSEADRAIHDSLTNQASRGALSRLEAHVHECPSCRLTLQRSAWLWQILSETRAPVPDPAAMQRIRAELLRHPRSVSLPRRVHLMSSIGSVGRLAVAAAAGIVVTLFAIRRGTPAPTPPEQHEYMLFLSTPTNGPAPSATELHQIVSEHRAWAEQLRHEGRLVVADKLTDDDGQSVPTVPVSNSPAPTERIGGFFLIRARDFDDAVHVAKDAPTIRYGGRITVRQIDNPT
jgi:hypothetical protein